MVGGLRVLEPAVDLAVAVGIASSLRDRPVDRAVAVIGEVGLSGELRSVNQLDRRVSEAARLGFGRAIVPVSTRKAVGDIPRGIELVRCRTVGEAIEAALA